MLEIVAEKTGYPKDMLDLDLDLEADLGVDTVKQAEMFAAVRAVYNIPRDENLKLRDFPTLAHVIKFAHDRSGLGQHRYSTARTAISGASLRRSPSPSPAKAARPVACQLRRREPHSTPRAGADLASRRSTSASQPVSRLAAPAAWSSCRTKAAWQTR